MKNPKFVKETNKIYSKFTTEIDSIRKPAPLKKGEYELAPIVASAYVKAYDFVLYLCEMPHKENAFFSMPVLRGICEDLITLSYLIDCDPMSQYSIIHTTIYDELNRALSSQEKYFKKYNPAQIILTSKLVPNTREAISMLKSNGRLIEERRLPSIQKMAKKTDLDDVYNYIYHATSKVVHFDIFSLSSMGWGEIDNIEGTIDASFSFKNNYRHYYTFTLFYASKLFIHQTSKFKSYLNLPNLIDESLKPMKDAYSKIDWPAIVEFMHMNIKEPSYIEKIMIRLYKEIEGDN